MTDLNKMAEEKAEEYVRNWNFNSRVTENGKKDFKNGYIAALSDSGLVKALEAADKYLSVVTTHIAGKPAHMNNIAYGSHLHKQIKEALAGINEQTKEK